MFGNGATMEAFRESESVLVGLIDDSFAGFQKNNSLGEWRGERFINRSIVSSLGISANPVTIEAFRELKMLCWILLMIRALLQPLFFGHCERTHKRNHHNTFDTMKASMVAGFGGLCWNPVDDPLPLQPSGDFFLKTGEIIIQQDPP